MNRPIKFRVWDNEKKIWLDKTDFCIYNGDAQEVEIGGTEYLHNGSSYNPLKFVENDLGGLYFNRNLIIQQYTGLKDKNGNPIYEGDVVARHHVDLVHKVEYLSNDYYKVEYCEKEAAYICRDCDGGFVYLSDFEYIVIGNRSEKPPCKFDHNFECMVCDGWPSDCPFVKFSSSPKLILKQ